MVELLTMRRVPWSILDDLESMQGRMNCLLSKQPWSVHLKQGAVEYPAMNIWSSAEGLVVDVEIPGAKQEELEVSMLGDILKVRGKLDECELTKGGTYLMRERLGGQFTRSIRLPFRVDGERIKAQYRNGILRITVPRVPEEKPRRVAIEA